MITHILLDADGVIIKAHEYYSQVYARKNNLPIEVMNLFFRDKFPACKLGKADLKIELAPYLAEWNPNETVDNYLYGGLEYEMHVDPQVLELVTKLKSKNIKFYLATDQEKYRAEFIKQLPGLDAVFDKMFFSYELGASKEDSDFFQKILEQLKIPANQVAYWDDEQENVDSAKKCGINSFFYSDFATFQEQLRSLNIDASI